MDPADVILAAMVTMLGLAGKAEATSASLVAYVMTSKQLEIILLEAVRDIVLSLADFTAAAFVLRVDALKVRKVRRPSARPQ